MTPHSLGHRAPLLWLVLPLIAGLATAKMTELPAMGWQLAIALVAAAAAVVAGMRRRPYWSLALAAAMFFAGTASYGLHRSRLLRWESLPSREARVTIKIERLFTQQDGRKASGLAKVIRADEHLRDLTGQRVHFAVTLRKGDRVPIRSAQIACVGVLVTLPRNPPAESFEGYLAGAGINFKFTRGRIVAEAQPAHPYYAFCARATRHCHAILGEGIAEKRPALAGLLRGMMLGDTHELSEEQHTLFMQSGTMHLFAISGLNIGVIAGALQALLLVLRLPRWVCFVIGAALLWLFVDITGAAPSAVRAFGMAVFLQAAFVLKRPANVLAALVGSAFVVLLVAPLQLFSASFLMSYTIVTALLVLGLPLGEAWVARWALWRDLPPVTWNRWQRWIDGAWRSSLQAVAVGVATTLVSLLTGLQFFQLLTPGALVANLVLIPAAMVVTLGGFASLVCGLAGFTAGAALCNHAAALILLIIEWLVRLSVKLPGAFVPAHFASPWIGPLALTMLMVALFVGYATEWKLKYGGWWPPFVIVAAVLLFGVNFE